MTTEYEAGNDTTPPAGKSDNTKRVSRRMALLKRAGLFQDLPGGNPPGPGQNTGYPDAAFVEAELVALELGRRAAVIRVVGVVEPVS